MDRLEFFLSVLNPGEGHWASRMVANDSDVLIDSNDALIMLKAYKEEVVSYAQLLDRANLLLFNDVFELKGDAVRDCLDRIEESDEPGSELTGSDVDALINSLRSADNPA